MFVLVAGLAHAAPAPPPISRIEADAIGSPSVALIDRALARGDISWPEAARQKMFYLFRREAMDPRFNVEGSRPARCGTLILDEIARNLDRVDAETRALYEQHAALEPQGSAAILSYETPHFYLEYSTTGSSAVPLTDVAPANGVPDYVENAGASAEQSWTTEVTNLGYHAPPATSTTSYNGKYLIQFQTQSSYGFTTVTSGTRTKIVLHNNFIGFPPNDDPDGPVLGAMRVTVAHEFKHAIQRTYTLWTEGGWVELDATWMEDIVYDNVNDYYNYIYGPGSPFTEPQTPLDADAASTTGSYEDCNWEHFQSEKLGLTHMRNFWTRRQANPAEPVLTTYEQNFIASGLSFADAWGEYTAWNFACGGHAGGAFGYGESAFYPTTGATSAYTSLPVGTTTGAVAHLAANIRLISNTDGLIGGIPEFTFTGNPATSWRVSIVVRDLGGQIHWIPMPLSGGAGTFQLTGYDYTELDYAALVISNPSFSGAGSYTFSARSVSPLAIAHVRPWDTTQTGSPYHLTARVTAGTKTPDPSAVALVYQLNGGGLTSLPMTATGNPNEYAADIPAQPVATDIQYRITAGSTTGENVAFPARTGLFASFDVVTVFEPFETAGSWTVGDAGDAATTGIWERALPVGTSAAPDSDYTLPPGTTCFVTENANPGDPDGTADVDNGKTTLLSPVYDLSGGGPYAQVHARYHRWYSNHLGQTVDDTWRVDVSNDGGTSWTNLETTAFGQNAWVFVNADVKALFGTVDRLRFRFVAEDQNGGSLVEAAVDDFEIVAVPQSAVAVSGGPGPASLGLALVSANPARSEVRLALELPRAGHVRASVRDARGRRVRDLLSNASLPEGRSLLSWDLRDDCGAKAGSGVYFFEVSSEAGSVSRRVVVMR